METQITYKFIGSHIGMGLVHHPNDVVDHDLKSLDSMGKLSHHHQHHPHHHHHHHLGEEQHIGSDYICIAMEF